MSLLERRLLEGAERLKRARAELAVIDEQLAFVTGEAEDARLRSLVSETPIADAEARDVGRQADALARERAHLLGRVQEHEVEQNALLDEMAADLERSGR